MRILFELTEEPFSELRSLEIVSPPSYLITAIPSWFTVRVAWLFEMLGS